MNNLKRENKYMKEWFSRGAMSFFNTKIHNKTLYKDKYFISSEHFDVAYPRLFTIREITEERIETLGEFQEYETLNQAKEAMKLL